MRLNPPDYVMNDSSQQPLHSHLAELRKRLLYSLAGLLLAFFGCYHFAGEIYAFLVAPLAELYQGQESRRLIYTGMTEAFFTYLRLAFYGALFIAFPFIAMQIYIFLAPGLYKKEKRVLLPFLIACPLLFLAGAATVYYGIFPLAWQFFLSFETMGDSQSLPIQLEARISEYLSTVTGLIFAFGIAFQLPILLTLLAKAHFLTVASLRRNRKYAIIAITIFAALVTPPDPLSQIALAVPLLLLYECSIWLCQWITKAEYKSSR